MCATCWGYGNVLASGCLDTAGIYARIMTVVGSSGTRATDSWGGFAPAEDAEKPRFLRTATVGVCVPFWYAFSTQYTGCK